MTDLGLTIPPTYILCMDRVGGMFLYEGAVIFILRRNIFFLPTPITAIFLFHADSAKEWSIREPCPITLSLDYRWLRAMISQSFA